MLSSNLQGLGLTDSPGPSLELPRLQRRQQHNDMIKENGTAPATNVKADDNALSDESQKLSQRLPEIDSQSSSNADTGSHIHYMVEKGILDASIENLLSLHNDNTSIRTAKLIKVGDSSQDSSGAGSTLGSWGGSASGHDLHSALNTGNTTTGGANRDTPQQEHDICKDFLGESMELIEDMSMPSFCESVELVSLDRTIDESPMKKVNKTPSIMEVNDTKGSSTKSVTFEDQLPASPRTPLTSTSLLDLGDALASSPKIAACTNLISEGTKSSYLSPKQIVDAKKRSWTEASFASGIFTEAGKLAKDIDHANLSGSGGSIGVNHLAPAFSPPLSAKIPSPMCSTASPRTPFDNSLELLDLENVDDSLLQMSPIALRSFVDAGPPLVSTQTLPGNFSKVTQSKQDDHLQEFSSIPPHELLLGDQQMPDFDPTRGSILAFKEQIPERGSVESKKKDVENITETKESEESNIESKMPKLERENTMDLLSGLSSHSQKLKALVGTGKTEEPKKPPEEVLNKTFEEIASVDAKPLNGTFDTDKGTAAVSSNLNVTIEQPTSKPVVAAAQVLNGTFDQDKPKAVEDVPEVLNGTFDQEKPTVTNQQNNHGIFHGTFNQPEFKNYCNLDLTFDQPDLLKVKQGNIEKKTNVLNGTFDQEELKKCGNLDGTFVQAEPAKQNQLNGTFDQPESKCNGALNSTFDQNITKKPETALNGTFDNPSTKTQGPLNETFDEVPKATLDCTFEATESVPKGPIVQTGLNGTFDQGDPGAANTTFDYISSTKTDVAVLNGTFDQNEEKMEDIVEDLNTTNLMDCGREALEQFIKLGTPTKGKVVASSTPKPAAKDGSVPTNQVNISVTKDSKMSFLQRMSMGLINKQDPAQQQESNEGEVITSDPSSYSNLPTTSTNLADLSRESAATALRAKQKSLIDRNTKAASGPVKALPFLPAPQINVEVQPCTGEDVAMDVAMSGVTDSPERRMTYNVPCDPSSPLGQFRKKLGVSVGSCPGSVTESLLDEANKMAADIGIADRESQSTSISRLKIEATVDLLEGISVLKDINSDGSASDAEYKFVIPDGKPKEIQDIQNEENLDFEGSDEVFVPPNEAFVSPDKAEIQEDAQDASTDSGSSDISVKSNMSVKQSKLGREKLNQPQSLPKARTSLLPAGNKRSSLHPKSKLAGTGTGIKSGMSKPAAAGTTLNKAATLPAQLDVNKVKKASLAPNNASQPKNDKGQNTLKPPGAANTRSQSKISPSLQRKSLAPKAVAPKTNVNTRQSLAPKAMTTRQSLAPKPSPARTSLAPKPTATRQSLAPKPTATRQSLAPKAMATRQSLAPKPTSTRQSLAPPKTQTEKPNVNNRQSLAPKPVAAKPTVTTRQSLAPKPVASTGLPKPSSKGLAKPSSSKPVQKETLASPKPVTKSLERPASPKPSSAVPQTANMKKSPSKQSPRKSNEENKLPEKRFGVIKKPGLQSPSKKSPRKSNEENKAPERRFGLIKPQSRLPMKAGVLEDATNLNPSSDTTTAKGTGISRLAALKQPGFGLNNVIDKKQVSKLVRKSSCLDSSPTREQDAPASKFPKLTKFSREPSADNLKLRKETKSSYGSTSSIDSDRPCTPDMALVDINAGTPNVYRPGSSSMVTSTPAMAGGYLGRLANVIDMDDNMSLPTPIPSAGSRLRFTSDKSTPTSLH